MPVTREFTIRMDDRAGALGKLGRTLSDRGVNILALQAATDAGKGVVRIVVDNAAPARNALDTAKMSYTEADVALISLPHRPGEMARAAARLGENSINIQHAYSGLDSRTNTPILIFGVADAGAAAKILDQATAAAGS
jgi:hypothetical protein